MAFCTNCGKQFADDAKFCPECGKTVMSIQTQGQRKQEYAGEIQKCPNCGSAISAFEAFCPTCGYELRNVKASNAVQMLSDTIAKIEATRPLQAPRAAESKSLSKRKSKDENPWEMVAELITPTDRSIANVIQNFAIPNNREDILEFMILASNSIDPLKLYPSVFYDTPESLIARAWYSKFEQSFQKARLAFGDGADFNIAKEIYEKKQAELQERKKKQRISRTIPFLLLGGLFLMLFSLLFSLRA